MKPILFNTEMVRAILDGRKTVTRRVVKPPVPKPCELRKMKGGYHDGEWHLYCEDPLLDAPSNSPWGAQFLPPFQPGDILYVRETWVKLWWVDMEGRTHYDSPMYYYAADGRPDIILRDEDGFAEEDQRIRWHPSIHMPKEAARIFLRVTGVKVRHLQDMTAEDSLREGVKLSLAGCVSGENPLKPFSDVWDGTIKKADLFRYSWDANPWVWVIEFERCEKPEE